MEFRDDAIGPIFTGVKIVKAKMIADEREDEDAAADPQGKPQDIDAGIRLVLPQVAPGDCHKVLKHG